MTFIWMSCQSKLGNCTFFQRVLTLKLVTPFQPPIRTLSFTRDSLQRQCYLGASKTNLLTKVSWKPTVISTSRFFSQSRHVRNLKSPRTTHEEASNQRQRNINTILYAASGFILMIGVSYAAVPLYKVFCQATGLGGELKQGHNPELVSTMRRVEDTILEINFNADTHSSMMWNFKPQQSSVIVRPGETALAFFKAKNPLNKPVIGISTYNVVPFEAAPYFNKIQCFCFEEQRLNPGEEVDLPVFFYIDPEFCDDPLLEDVKDVTLSYCFFEAKEGFKLPLPGYPRQ